MTQLNYPLPPEKIDELKQGMEKAVNIFISDLEIVDNNLNDYRKMSEYLDKKAKFKARIIQGHYNLNTKGYNFWVIPYEK